MTFYNAMWKECDMLQINCGIYTSAADWYELFGTEDYCSGQNHRLWYYDIDHQANFNDFTPFGCWTPASVWGKTYNDDTKYCGISMQMVYIPTQ